MTADTTPKTPAGTPDTAEHRRLAEATGRAEDGLFDANHWYEWGPYLAERAWGTVREDYSADGNAWASFPHDHARSRAYRWNEDGMAGISDIRGELSLALGLWNGVDPILKERMFGLTGPEGNHGEDVKECWWYLEGLPSHALLRWRYHYPQAAFPYADLVAENGRRDRTQPEYELLDTGIFDDGRFWIVEVTYAKSSPTEILVQVDIENHGPGEATLHVLPTLWFRNTWRWSGSADIPALGLDGEAVTVHHPRLDGYRLEAAPGPDGAPPVALFCDNETNAARLYGSPSATPYPKDGINDHVVAGAPTVNPDSAGTKAAWWYRCTVPGGGRAQLRLRLHRTRGDGGHAPDGAGASRAWAGASFTETVAQRERDADEFYGALAGGRLAPDRMRILRQASAGLVWSKQFYWYRVGEWLDGDPAMPAPPPGHATSRNSRWRHLDAHDILAMPDPWEYPWFAAWDLAFHAVAWAHLDPAFAKYQLVVLLREWFLNPNGGLPAYEWNFDDVNPPVHALAAARVFLIDGGTDTDFLERVFQKLLLNFTWWLNRLDPDGKNIFGGGFLGLDNISPIDRSSLPPHSRLEQADGTAWMAFYALSMLVIARRLADTRPVYEDMVVKFVEQYLLIVEAMEETGLRDPEDGWFYDRFDGPEGSTLIRVQTLVGAIPLLPAAVIRTRDAEVARRLRHRFDRLVAKGMGSAGEGSRYVRYHADGDRVLLSALGPGELRTALGFLLDEEAFLSPHGLRSLSKRHQVPYVVPGHPDARIEYEPGEGRTGMYGGNSNWRGPVWMPLNVLIIPALMRYHQFLGDEFRVEYPTGSGVQRSLADIAKDLATRLVSIWLPGADGGLPVFGDSGRFRADPAWQGLLWFPEYFHGDTGAGLGAMHQTGWTAEVINLLLDPTLDSAVP